jgi:hypothetical protein
MVYAQALHNESQWKWKHPYISIASGVKSLLGVRSTYDFDFSWIAIIIACLFVVNASYTISMQVESTMTTSIKVWKLSLVIRISIPRWVWWSKRWETSFWTYAPPSKAITAIVSWSVSLAVVCSLLPKHQSKWVFK